MIQQTLADLISTTSQDSRFEASNLRLIIFHSHTQLSLFLSIPPLYLYTLLCPLSRFLEQKKFVKIEGTGQPRVYHETSGLPTQVSIPTCFFTPLRSLKGNKKLLHCSAGLSSQKHALLNPPGLPVISKFPGGPNHVIPFLPSLPLPILLLLFQ